MTGATLVWLRDDLRVGDNPALRAGADRDAPLVVLYLLDERTDGIRPLGGATRWWLHHSLAALGDDIAGRGGRLLLRRGAAEDEIPRVVRDAGVDTVYWNRRYGPTREADARIKAALRDDGIDATSFAADLLVEPDRLATGDGAPYRVFTPFWRAAQQQPERDPVPAPRALPGPPDGLDGDDLAEWGLLPTRPDWAGGLAEAWEPGEAGARRRLEAFVADGLARYHRRDEPAVEATSRLSPHLRFGEISAEQVRRRVRGDVPSAARGNVPKFLSEVGWREFHRHVLFHEPDLVTRNHRPAFDAFPWSWDDGRELEAWRRGRTGIPLVDAGMRELWHTGWMHNRVRMVVASLLVKNLLRHWRVGEEWFWDTLVDADEASNAGNWQWVAGSGADAAPYFRVFNPELQASKFDPDGEYVRRWVPELGTADYPEPIVDLAESRREALAAYEVVKRSR